MRFIVVPLLCLCLAACAATVPQKTARANLQTDLDNGVVGTPMTDETSNTADFRVWADDFTQRAIAAGYDPVTTQRVMASVQFRPKIIALDQKQPESQLTLQQYLAKTVTADRIATGRAKFAENAAALQNVAQQTGVPASIIVALWGKETSYGAVMGGYPIADALATLAYEGRRRAMFEKELAAFIQVTQRVGRDPSDLQGSWAGAMGQCQFMPTSYLKYAVDGDGDGLADIWTSTADVFASAANFLAQSGWQARQPVAIPVTLPAALDPSIIGRDKPPRAAAQWLNSGVRSSANIDPNLPARLYAPDGPTRPAFMIFPNFDVIMRWNSSGYFVTGVALLADHLD